MRIDNIEHKTLFTIPTASFSTAMAVPKALPPQEVVTGHKQTDAYLWILKVIRLNEPAHLDAAEAALGKLKISPKDAQQRYIDYLHRTGAHPLQIAFGTMSMDNPAGYIKAAKKAIETASSVRNIFGSYEAALEKTQAEKMMLVGELAEIYEPFYYWNEQEKLEECMYGQRIIETMALRKATSKGFADVLPTPNSISDVVNEILYWRWLHEMRRTAYEALYNEYYHDEDCWITDREDYLDNLLCQIKPSSRAEASSVCEWILGDSRYELGSGNTKEIILNLVRECA